MSYTYSILVTGGTINLGYHAALTIARKSPDALIVVSSRTDPEHAADRINQATGQKNAIFLPLDLSNEANVRKFAANWVAAKHPPIKALVLNAGLQFPGPVSKNEAGIEKTFAINHVGHALLFHLLYPELAPNARVVVTSSGTHDPAQKSGLPDAIYDSAELLAHPSAETEKYEGRQRYATSKLVNILWTYALDRKLKQHAPEKHITVTAFDPGLMPGTGLAREYSTVLRFIWNQVLTRIMPLLRLIVTPNVHTPEESGAALARLAVDEDVKGVSGKYVEGLKEIPSSKDSYVVEKQDDLWMWTVTHLANGDKAEAARYSELR
jgi:NAD(P)-dependent dehydrogenase (short-subunit alcohol dehydrogenase family)